MNHKDDWNSFMKQYLAKIIISFKIEAYLRNH